MTFKDMNLNKALWNALDDLQITVPTKIQQESFNVIMSGRDMVGIAQTGTGKTFAFLLPLLRLWRFSKDRFAQIMILVPTRELVVQIVDEIEKLAQYTNVHVVGVYGESNIRKQMAAVEAGLDVIVGTPGRTFDLIMKGSLNTKNIKKIVIDEVDEMLDLGFRPQLTRIFDLLPVKRQNLMFSATLTDDVEAILNDYFVTPVKVEAAASGTPLELINQVYYALPNFHSKMNALKILLDNPGFKKVMVFVGTKKKADLVFDILDETFPEKVGIVHSNKSQNYRFQTIQKFAQGDITFLIATDLVSRGLDISKVTHVINIDIPEIPENYIHRIGRTGRAEEKGEAISFVKPAESEAFEAIERLMEIGVPMLDVPESVELSEELIDEEMPNYKMKNVLVKRHDADRTGAAFHEKKEKNKKVNKKKTLQEIRAEKALRKKRKRSKKKR